LGSAYIEFEVCAGSSNRKRVVFSGNLGAPYSPLLPAPKSPYRCDELVIESTYGDRCHESRHHRRASLKHTIERCLENKGTVLIPVFSIGHTQEHEKLLGHLKDSGRAAIVIAARGMCSGGRMQNYLQELLQDERTDVIFVGYQAKGTPGRDIQRYGAGPGSKDKRAYVQFKEDGRAGAKVNVHAGVYTLRWIQCPCRSERLGEFCKAYAC
jgi:Cft2 family RNA processing exonuclease